MGVPTASSASDARPDHRLTCARPASGRCCAGAGAATSPTPRSQGTWPPRPNYLHGCLARAGRDRRRSSCPCLARATVVAALNAAPPGVSRAGDVSFARSAPGPGPTCRRTRLPAWGLARGERVACAIPVASARPACLARSLDRRCAYGRTTDNEAVASFWDTHSHTHCAWVSIGRSNEYKYWCSPHAGNACALPTKPGRIVRLIGVDSGCIFR